MCDLVFVRGSSVAYCFSVCVIYSECVSLDGLKITCLISWGAICICHSMENCCLYFSAFRSAVWILGRSLA